MEIFTAEGFWALLQVIGIDLVLAGDNAIVIGLAVAGLPAEQRRKAIIIGIAAATILRVIFALMTTWLLGIPGLLFFGGLLLLYVCWKMFVELRDGHRDDEVIAEEALSGADVNADGKVAPAPRKTLRQAATQILIADVSMSLDNVLAVAGAAKDHPTILVIGLAIAILMMAFAATFIAKLLARHAWIAWVGLVIILYVSGKMMWDGWKEIDARWFSGEQPAVTQTAPAPETTPAGTTTAPAPAGTTTAPAPAPAP